MSCLKEKNSQSACQDHHSPVTMPVSFTHYTSHNPPWSSPVHPSHLPVTYRTPSPVGLFGAGSRLQGGGSNVRVMFVFPLCFWIFVFCVIPLNQFSPWVSIINPIHLCLVNNFINDLVCSFVCLVYKPSVSVWSLSCIDVVFRGVV